MQIRRASILNFAEWIGIPTSLLISYRCGCRPTRPQSRRTVFFAASLGLDQNTDLVSAPTGGKELQRTVQILARYLLQFLAYNRLYFRGESP